VRLGRQQDDRARLMVSSKLPAHLEPVLAGKHHIEEYEIERLGFCSPDRFVSRCHNCRAVTLALKISLESERDSGLVFDNKNSHHRVTW
jgi:hypothetical protein